MKITKLIENIEVADEKLQEPELETAEAEQQLESVQALTEADDPTVREAPDGSSIEVDVTMTSMDDTAAPATKKESLKIKNALTDILDRALNDAQYALEEENFKANCNVLVSGLPGSSKTATIRNWCDINGCQLYYLDAKNPDLQLLTSGASAIDRTDPEHPKVNTAYSNALAKLDRPNSILFLDELNRQVREYMRGSLLTLVADRCVAGEGEDGFRYFPNLLFTIAAINPPAGDRDKGATELNAAEDRRFYYGVEFHSEVPTTQVYLKEYYDNKLREYVSKRKETGLTATDIARINSLCLRQWIGLKLILDEDFHYTTVDEYQARTEKGQITCQSTITELIDHSRGDLDRLVHDINAGRLTKRAKEMLINIINKMVLPNVDALRAKKAAELGLDLGSVKETSAKVEDPTEVDDDDMIKPEDFLSGREDDVAFHDDGSGSTGTGSYDSSKVDEARVSDATIIARLSASLTGKV